MNIKKLKLLFFAGLFFGFANVSLAQTPSGELRLTTSPLPINLKVTPGTSVSAPIKIKNDGTQTENLKVSLMKFKANPVTGAAELEERQPEDSYFDWVTFSDQTFSLPSNEWKTITATFNVPATAAFDYYYAIVFFRADQQTNTGTNQTVLNGGTATMVLLTADVPNAKKELQLDQFTVNKNIFEFLPATFDIKIKNTGNVHVIPHGNIFISSSNQKDVAVLNVNETQGSILPDSPRTFQTDWTDGFPKYENKQENGIDLKDTNGKTIQELVWNWKDASKLRWGKYTAKMVLVYDDGKRDVPIEGEVTFWVIPWRIIGIIVFNFGLIVGLIMYVIRLRRRLKKMGKK